MSADREGTGLPDGYDLTGRVAVVTGGGSGIGAAIAMQLARYGADIAIAGRTLDRLESQAAEIAAATGRPCLTVTADVREADQAEAMVARVIERFGRIDILVNNAGGARQMGLAKVSPQRWDGEFALNCHAAFYGSHAALPHMVAQGGGAIVNISSFAGLDGTTGAGPYSAAKAALQMFTRVAAAEWGPKGIRVNCVAPGMTATPLARANWARFDYDVEAACKSFALRRPGTPEEVARAVVFLASDAASYITGETLAVSGGRALGGMVEDL